MGQVCILACGSVSLFFMSWMALSRRRLVSCVLCLVSHDLDPPCRHADAAHVLYVCSRLALALAVIVFSIKNMNVNVNIDININSGTMLSSSSSSNSKCCTSSSTRLCRQRQRMATSTSTRSRREGRETALRLASRSKYSASVEYTVEMDMTLNTIGYKVGWVV